MEQVWLCPLYSWRDVKHKQDKMISLSSCCVTEPGLNAVHQNPISHSPIKIYPLRFPGSDAICTCQTEVLKRNGWLFMFTGLGNMEEEVLNSIKKWYAKWKVLSVNLSDYRNPNDCIDFSRAWILKWVAIPFRDHPDPDQIHVSALQAALL